MSESETHHLQAAMAFAEFISGPAEGAYPLALTILLGRIGIVGFDDAAQRIAIEPRQLRYFLRQVRGLLKRVDAANAAAFAIDVEDKSESFIPKSLPKNSSSI